MIYVAKTRRYVRLVTRYPGALLSLSLSSPAKPKPLTEQRSSAAAEIFLLSTQQFETSFLSSSLSHRFSSSLPALLSPSAPPSLGLVILLAFTCQARENLEELDSLLTEPPYVPCLIDRSIFRLVFCLLERKRFYNSLLFTRLGTFIIICAFRVSLEDYIGDFYFYFQSFQLHCKKKTKSCDVTDGWMALLDRYSFLSRRIEPELTTFKLRIS